MTMIADRLPVIDTDAHISEPGDLWTSRLPKKYVDIAPRIVRMPSIDDPESDEQDIWVIDEDRKFFSGWEMSWAGWKHYWPKHPPIKELVDPACYDGPGTAEVIPPKPLGRMARKLREIAALPVERRPVDLYAALAEEMAHDIHALSLVTRAPGDTP